jgi:hypothetical protein
MNNSHPFTARIRYFVKNTTYNDINDTINELHMNTYTKKLYKDEFKYAKNNKKYNLELKILHVPLNNKFIHSKINMLAKKFMDTLDMYNSRTIYTKTNSKNIINEMINNNDSSLYTIRLLIRYYKTTAKIIVCVKKCNDIQDPSYKLRMYCIPKTEIKKVEIQILKPMVITI